MIWGYKYFLNAEVYHWAKPGFILTAVLFILVGIPVYLIDSVVAGHAVSGSLALIDVGLVLIGSALVAARRDAT